MALKIKSVPCKIEEDSEEVTTDVPSINEPPKYLNKSKLPIGKSPSHKLFPNAKFKAIAQT